MLTYRNVSLRDCIRVAYRLKEFQIEGPDSLDSARFDITARLPDGSTKDQIPEMLQSMLEDRFALKFHRYAKEHAVYELVLAKGGPTVKALEAPVKGGYNVAVLSDGVHVSAVATPAAMAEVISHFCDRPVVDKTGLAGMYDFKLVFSARQPAGSNPEAGADASESVSDALQRYGLRPEPRKAPLDVVVVDSARTTPTEN